MARIREVTKYSSTYVIKLNPADMRDLEIKEGDQVDIEDIVFLKKKGGKNNGKI